MRLTSLFVRAGSIAVLLFVALFARPAAADDPKRAKELFQEGTTFFDVGQFDKAIEAWQAGYKAKPDPGFLYNIAQAYRISGDPQKAIFFYRGYLRNSPNAENRVEVEQKIVTLQKQLAELERNKPGPPPPAHPSAGPPPATTPSAPSSPPFSTRADKTAAGAPSPALEGPPPVPSSPAVELAAAPEAPGSTLGGRFDLNAVLGTDTWESGFEGNAQPSFALALGAGYTFGGRADRRASFRLGGVFGYTFLSERASRPKFWSFLVEPMLRYRVSENWTLSGAFGVGVLAISGLSSTSVLLTPKPGFVVMVNGTQSLPAIRPALGAEYRLTDSLAAMLTLAFPYSPKGENFNGPIRRSELLLGLGYHL